MLTGLIWSIEVAVLCLLIRTANKYRTKSYQVNISSLLPEFFFRSASQDGRHFSSFNIRIPTVTAML